jgi:Na+/melibiose symporter-like transporter|tara:strand:+ start:345 stop:740 length:396 start_codon:yes stop_codon:yes gene_type:complete
MKTKRALIILVGLTLTFTVGILAYSQMEEIQPKMLLIYGLIGVVAVISIFRAIKKMKEEKEGQPSEDELTTQIKHKAGHDAYIASLYMWLFIFLFRDIFPDSETMVGGGILLTGLIGFISKTIASQKFNEK